MSQYTLKIYQPNDSTVLLEVGTDPSHPKPWLSVGDFGTESTVDLKSGRATIGESVVRIIDPQSGATQQIRAVTALLPDLKVGLRARLYDVTNSVVIKDGVLGDHRLLDDDVTYEFHIRDIQERQRTVGLFHTLDTLPAGAYRRALLPAGVFGGYGRTTPTGRPVLSPQVAAIRGVYRQYGIAGTYGGLFHGPLGWRLQLTEYDLDTLLDHAGAIAKYDAAGNYTGDTYGNLIVRWRAAGSTDAWKELADMPVYRHSDSSLVKSGTAITTPKERFFKPGFRPDTLDEKFNFVCRMNVRSTDTALLPAHNQQIEIQILPAGRAPSPATPLYIEQNAGTFVRQILDGEYSPYDPQIRYDESAIAAIEAEAPMVRDVITAPVENAKEWLERRILFPLGYIPTLNDAGEYAPRKLRLPTSDSGLVNITSSNTTASSWGRSAREAINKLVWRSLEDSVQSVTAFESDESTVVLGEREIQDWFPNPDSIALLGEKAVEVDFSSFRSFTTADVGEGTGPAPRNDLARRMATERKGEVFDRFRFGGDMLNVTALRTDPAVEGLRVGDWCVVAISAMPDVGTGVRGTNRLMQVVKRKPVSPIEVELSLLDAGPSASVLPLPVIGVPTVSGRVVTVPVTTVPAVAGTSTRAVVQYAVAASEPAVSSGLWRYGGERTSAGSLVLPEITERGTVYVRARLEGAGRISSGWTATRTAAVSNTPALGMVTVAVDDPSGGVDVRWSPPAWAFGLRLRWVVYAIADGLPGTFPATYDAEVDVDALALSHALPVTLAPGEAIAVRVTPYADYSDTTRTASGAAGTSATVIGQYEEIPDPDAPIVALEVLAELVETGATTVKVTVTATDPSGAPGTPTISIESVFGIPGGIGAITRTGNTFTIPRPTAGSGQGRVTFRGTLAGRYGDSDSVDVAEQGADSVVPLSVQLTLVDTDDADITVRLTYADPLGELVNSDFTITPSWHGVAAPTQVGSGTGWREYEIGRPLPGAGIGRVQFAVTAPGRLGDSDSIDVPEMQTGDTILPTVEEVATHDATTGSLTINVKNDVQGRVSRVDFSRRSGRGSASNVQDSSPPYSTTVTLAEGVESSISYSVIGTDAAGVTGQVLFQNVVSFPKSARPATPVVTLSVAENGQVMVHASGDEATQSFRYNFSTVTYPDASSGFVLAGREASVSIASTPLIMGGRMYVTVIAYTGADGTGVASVEQRAVIDRQNKVTNKTMRLFAGSFVPSSHTAQYSRSGGVLTGASATPSGFSAPLYLPAGSTITGIDWNTSRPDSGTTLTWSVGRVLVNGSLTAIGSGSKVGIGWSTQNMALAESVTAGNAYNLVVTLGNGAVFGSALVYYTSPDLSTSI